MLSGRTNHIAIATASFLLGAVAVRILSRYTQEDPQRIARHGKDSTIESKQYGELCDIDRPIQVAEEHYDADYFAWQVKQAEANAYWQIPQIRKSVLDIVRDRGVSDPQAPFNILEIGCGAGKTLEGLNFSDSITSLRRFCLEISEVARETHEESLVSSFGRWSDLPNHSLDFAYSFDSLEHHPSPLDSMLCLRSKMKTGGIVRMQVPFEHLAVGHSKMTQPWLAKYRPDDRNFHLFTWTPQSLGNLLSASGFKVTNCTDMASFMAQEAEAAIPRIKSPVYCEGLVT